MEKQTKKKKAASPDKPVSKRELTKDEKAQIATAYALGISMRDIAEMNNISVYRARKIVDELIDTCQEWGGDFTITRTS